MKRDPDKKILSALMRALRLGDSEEAKAYNAGCIRAAEEIKAEFADLLSAARQVEDWWLREGMNVFSGAPSCIFDLRAAIAKAEGR